MVHLHTRSAYSLLQSTFRVEEIVLSARQAGMKAVCLSDFQVMHGTMQFIHLCRKEGIKPILGMEAVLKLNDTDLRFVLLAENDTGLQQLYALSCRFSKTDEILMEEAAASLDCCIAIACGVKDGLETALMRSQKQEIYRMLETMKSAFGSRLYLAMAMNDSRLRQELSQQLKAAGKELEIPGTALSMIYYRNEQDVELLKILRAIDRQTILSDQRLDAEFGRYFRNEAQMAECYEKEDLEESEKIAAACNVTLSFQKSGLPVFKNKLHLSSDEYLKALCHAGLKKRLPGEIGREYIQRLNYELDVILSMKFTDYFLIVWDFIRFARSRNILVGPGRGSAAGSLVAYCLGITHIDPVKNKLLFERFLNPERVSMPDIDTDVQDSRRDEVVQYLHDTYGQDHAAQIITFSNMKARSVLRDVGRVMTIPVRTIDSICRLVPNTPGMNLETARKQSPAMDRMISGDPRLMKLYAAARKLEGLPRHTSIHAAGVVLSDQPIDNVCPRMEVDGASVTQFTMEYLEELGLIKMDVLALRNLTIIDEVLVSIENYLHQKIDINKIPLDDGKVYQMLQQAQTTGIFQLESDGIRQLILQMHPVSFEDISQIIALYRPGPMQNIHAFLKRKNHPEQIEYLHPLLEPILKDTYGIIVYQEQTMQIAQAMGGFTLSQADLLRKAMSKKKRDVMESYRDQFLQGALKKGVSESTAATVFAWMERFADYGFNKSHSYAYGLIVYQMAWLKANYPLFFYQALLDSAVGSDSKSAQYIHECRIRQLQILPVSISRSAKGYAVEENGLRMPFKVLKGIGRSIYDKILQERSKGPFQDLYDAMARLLACRIPESALRTLISAGAFDEFKMNRASLQKNLGRILEYCALIRIDSQEVLFDYSIVSPPSLVMLPEDKMERAAGEYAVYGFYLSEHPAASVRTQYYRNLPPIVQVLEMTGFVQVLGRVVSWKMHKTKKGEVMCFMNIEDESQHIDVVIMPSLLAMHREKIAADRIVLAKGRKDRPGSMLANRLDWIEA